MKKRTYRCWIGFSLGAMLLLSLSLSCAAQQSASAPQGSALTIPQANLIQPLELVAILQKPSPPLILQVGSHVLYAEAHIPKSEFIGSVNQPAGHDALAKRVSSLPRNAPIIIYCGCCPWERCPNIAAAFEQLHAMGFTSVKALYIAGNFGDDWVAKGYSVERGR